jgi:hypothetical protein
MTIIMTLRNAAVLESTMHPRFFRSARPTAP